MECEKEWFVEHYSVTAYKMVRSTSGPSLARGGHQENPESPNMHLVKHDVVLFVALFVLAARTCSRSWTPGMFVAWLSLSQNLRISKFPTTSWDLCPVNPLLSVLAILTLDHESIIASHLGLQVLLFAIHQHPREVG